MPTVTVDVDLDEFDDDELLAECRARNLSPIAFSGRVLEEITDLIAEAARTSPHATRAYSLMQDEFGLGPLPARQQLISGRMGYAA